MPSPFPGMDPWLEHPDIFPDLHDRLNTHVSEALQGRLPPPYFAVIGRRVLLEVARRYVGPDVQVLRRPRIPGTQNGGAAVASRTSRATVVHVPHDERLETFLEVYAGRGKDKRLVTTIEILSWANKTPGEQGRELYLRKQREILDSKVHLVEIDLLRGGSHATAVPRGAAVEAVGEFDYHVCVHRFDVLEDFMVYPIALDERLPEIEVPLLPGDGSTSLDLQAAFDRCYDSGPYQRELRYLEDVAIPPLTAEQEAWARERIQDWSSDQ